MCNPDVGGEGGGQQKPQPNITSQPSFLLLFFFPIKDRGKMLKNINPDICNPKEMSSLAMVTMKTYLGLHHSIWIREGKLKEHNDYFKKIRQDVTPNALW